MILRNRLKERRAALNVNQQEMGRLCGGRSFLFTGGRR